MNALTKTHTVPFGGLREGDEITHIDDNGEFKEYTIRRSTIAPKAERVTLMANVLTGLTMLEATKPNLFVETRNMMPKFQRGTADIIVRQTDGFTITEDTWLIRLYEGTAAVIVHDGEQAIEYSDPMDALARLHTEMQR